MSGELKIAGVIRESIVDGPGMRFVVFGQGCPHRCEGCHNPQTHDFNGGQYCRVDRLLEEIKKDPLLKGVTFSGGEPFCQPEEFCELADGIIGMGLDIIIYSGYTFEELVKMGEENHFIRDLLERCYLLIDGRFELENRSLSLLFRGSTNQRLIDVKASLEAGRAVEKEF